MRPIRKNYFLCPYYRMPFVRRRRMFRRRRSMRKVPTTVKRYVRRQVNKNVENKFKLADMTTNFSSVGSANWTELELNTIATGTAISERVGNEVKLMGFALDGTIVGGQSNLASDDNRNTFRIVLALWDATNAVPLATNGANLSSLITSRTVAGKGLIRKFIDKTFNLPSPGRDSTGYMPSMKRIHIFKKLYRIIKYYGSATTNGNNKLILSMISDSALVSHPGFVNGRWSLYFQDA